MARSLKSFALVLILSVPSFAAGPREVKPGWNLFSKQQDVQLGREAASQVEKQMPVIHDGQLQDQIERIGRRLVATGMADEYPYTFKVVNEQSINAFALPGGPTFVHTGLIKAADNEAQLAGVMAHEIAHVALRHGTNQASKANLIQLPAMLAGAVIGGDGSMLGQLAQLGIGLGANSVLLKYSRNAETQADVLGSRMMAKAGYNPLEMARFFEKLEAQGGRGGPQFLSSHPNPGDRMKVIQEEIQYLPRSNYSNGDTAAFRDLQSRVGSLPAQAKSRTQAGAVGTGDPRPSGRMREYRSSAFALSHPDNWEAFGDNQGAMVTIAPRAGLVQDGRGSVAIGYGVMVSFANPHEGGRNLRQDTQDLIGQLSQSNPGMQTGGRQQNVRVGNSPGLVTTLYNQSPMGGREINMLVTAQRPEGLFYMIFIGPEREFTQLQPIYEQMLRTVRFN